MAADGGKEDRFLLPEPDMLGQADVRAEALAAG
jgi:hypothetical protein